MVQKSPLYAVALLIASAVSFAAYARESTPAAVTVKSPNGKAVITLSALEGQLHISASLDKKPVLRSSPLVMSIDGVELTRRAKLLGETTYEVDEKYAQQGPRSVSRNHAHGAKVEIVDEGSGAHFTIDLRAYDGGVAFRQLVPAGDGPAAAREPDEATRFMLPKECELWFHNLSGHYEATYEHERAAELEPEEWLAPPVLVKLPHAGGYAAITEADLRNYSGMALQAAGDGALQLSLGHEHPASYPFRLRYEEDIERLKARASVTGDIQTPWRVILMGTDLNALVNSDVVPNLCPPPEPSYFPEGPLTPWVKPGRAVWKYLDGGGQSLEDIKQFSRWAGELGFEYQVIEGFWTRWSDAELRELVEYSRSQGVGLWFWRHSKELRSPEAREEFFSRLHELGVVGAKIDFFDHEHKEVVELYRALLEDAARHQIMVNFHGANKPTGESRTWPNELTREAVRGMEARRLNDRARHNATLPFARYLAGPGDYTPVIFGDRRGDTTWAHQIATAVVFDQPLLTYGAHPESLLASPAVELIKAIPSVWDETLVLPGSEVGELAAFARRSGADWFLAVLNGPEPRSETVELSFLNDASYRSSIVADGEGGATSLRVGDKVHRRGDVLKLELPAGGGFIARFVP